MGCVASKLEEEEEVVSICRERKNQLKLAVQRRYALAEAHWRYSHSLYAVSAAIKLFVARHSSPSSPFLITFPPPNPTHDQNQTQNQNQNHNMITNPMFLQQTPSESTCEAIDCGTCGSSTNCSEEEEEEEEEEQEEEQVMKHQGQGERAERHEHVPQQCGFFYMQMPPSMPSPQRDFGWDFFNPFDSVNRPDILAGYRRNSDEEELRAVREEEGIPELEEDHQESNKVVLVQGNVHSSKDDEACEANNEVVKVDDETGLNRKSEQKGLQVIDTPVEGRELLEALKDIEDYFIKAYESGKDVSRMLEANMVQMQSGLEEIKENSTKLIQSITWQRSISSKPSSCKSLVASSSKSSSTNEFKNDFFDDYGGMDSGSHSLTLGRLYAWEKKLYEEVKAGDTTRKLYDKKCSRLRNHDIKGDDELSMDKTRATVKDLYARILVAIRSAESISKRIEKLRDEELQPQVIELLKGLNRTWKVMLECHETQNKILFEVKTFAAGGKFCNESHRLATVQLQAELHNWRACFVDYVSAQRGYIVALHDWLTKFIVPEVEFYSRSKGSALPGRAENGPPLLVICRAWLASAEKLPEKPVAFALRSFARDVKALWAQQGEEQDRKRRVDGLAKELDRRALALRKTETRFLDPRPAGPDSRGELLRDQLEASRRKLEAEKERHRSCVVETQRITLAGFQTGFCAVFESLVEFSKASQNMYNDLVSYSENEKAENVSFLEDDTKVEQNSR